MNISEHTYRVLKAQWEIYVNIIAGYTSMRKSNYKNTCTEICPGLWAAYINPEEFNFHKEGMPVECDKQFLWDGLKKVSESILMRSPYKSDTLIVIHAIFISLCDFQEEGLTAAIIEWAAKVFGFEAPLITVNFNKMLNRYEFIF